MTGESFVSVLVLSAFGLPALSIRCEAAESNMRADLARATEATGGEYLRLRHALVASGPTAERECLDAARSSPDWRQRLLAAIVIERIRSGDKVVAPAAGQLASQKGTTKSRVASAGKALEEHFRPCPMVLAEALWKGDEVCRIVDESWPVKDSAEHRASIIHALVLLREKRVARLLLHLLEKDGSDAVRIAAAEGIRCLGSSELLADLIRIACLGKRDVVASKGAWQAMASCHDESSVEKLREAATAATDPQVRSALETEIRMLHRMREGSTRTVGSRAAAGDKRKSGALPLVSPDPIRIRPRQTSDCRVTSENKSETKGGIPPLPFWLGLTAGVGCCSVLWWAMSRRRDVGKRPA